MVIAKALRAVLTEKQLARLGRHAGAGVTFCCGRWADYMVAPDSSVGLEVACDQDILLPPMTAPNLTRWSEIHEDLCRASKPLAEDGWVFKVDHLTAYSRAIALAGQQDIAKAIQLALG